MDIENEKITKKRPDMVPPNPPVGKQEDLPKSQNSDEHNSKPNVPKKPLIPTKPSKVKSPQIARKPTVTYKKNAEDAHDVEIKLDNKPEPKMETNDSERNLTVKQDEESEKDLSSDTKGNIGAAVKKPPPPKKPKPTKLVVPKTNEASGTTPSGNKKGKTSPSPTNSTGVRKRSSGPNILASFKARFSGGSKEEKDTPDVPKAEKKKKKSLDRSPKSSESKSKFYLEESEILGQTQEEEEPVFSTDKENEQNNSTFYLSCDNSNNADNLENSANDGNGNEMPVLPPKRRSYIDTKQDLIAVDIDIQPKKEPRKPVRKKRRKKNLDGLSNFHRELGSDLSSCESLLESDQSESGSVIVEDSHGNKGQTTEEGMKRNGAGGRALRRKQDAFKSFTTEDMDIFQRKSVDNDIDDTIPENEAFVATTNKASTMGQRSSRDPLKEIKKERRRSKSVGAPEFLSLQLKPVVQRKGSSAKAKPLLKPSCPPPPPPPLAGKTPKPPGPSKSALSQPGVSTSPGKDVSVAHDSSLPSGHKQGHIESANAPSMPSTHTEQGSEQAGKGIHVHANSTTSQTAPIPVAPKRRSKLKDSFKKTRDSGVIEKVENNEEVKKDLGGRDEYRDSDLYDNALNVDIPAASEEGSVGNKGNESDHYYSNIPSPHFTIERAQSGIYEEIEFSDQENEGEKKESDQKLPAAIKQPCESGVGSNEASTENMGSQVPNTPTIASNHSESSGQMLMVPQVKHLQDSGDEGQGDVTKVRRKVSRKLSRKLTRKLTQRVKERNVDQKIIKKANKHIEFDDEAFWRDFLREESLEAAEDEANESELDFSETDSEWDEFSDESDFEFEQELYARLEIKLKERGQLAATEEEIAKDTPEERVRKIANELLMTEKAYVERLRLIDQVFHFKVVMENRTHRMFPEDVIPQMFSNTKSIFQLHNEYFLPNLQKRMEQWEEIRKIGDVMFKFAPFLKLYSEYVKNFDHAMNVIQAWQVKEPRFFAIMDEIHKSPECGHLTLQHHMLEPIQRVPRYELLLKEYLKRLPEDSPDKEDAQRALDLVSTAASHSNEAFKKMEKFRKMLEINESLGGAIDLTSPTRELVKEGSIIKISPRNGVQQERYIYLFNDLMLVCESILLSSQYRIRNKMEIEGMQILEGDNLELPNTFYVKSKTKTVELHCKTIDEKVEWQVSLWTVIGDFTKKQMSRKAGPTLNQSFLDEEIGKRAPKWIKDSEATMCMMCGSAFTKFRRRHHCRACGIVVCGKCSTHKSKLAYDNYKANRVCDKCHVHLLDKGGDISSPSLSEGSSPANRRRGILQVKATEKSIISGYLHMTLDKKVWTKRYFAVHEDFVLYSFGANHDVSALTSMPLPGYNVSEATEKDKLDRQNVFKLTHPQQKTYYFQIMDNDKHSLNGWVHVMQCVTNAELPSAVNLGRSSSSVSGASAVASSVPPSLPTIR